MAWPRTIRPGALAALFLVVLSCAVLEYARLEIAVTRSWVGDTPVTHYAAVDADGPPVIVAHGFAGSSAMMQGYALDLARAGYRVHVFDFLGHGRHPRPMSGDVTSIDGTTRLLIDQIAEVADAVAAGAGTFAVLGHSMATDVLVRFAEERSDIGAVVLISAFSEAIDAETPANLLLITGAAEPGLRDFALDALRMVDPAALEGDVVRRGGVIRQAVVAPWAEHVSVLHSRAGRAAAISWLDTSFGRDGAAPQMLPTGQALLALIAGLVWLCVSLARALPDAPQTLPAFTSREIAIATLLPAAVAPPLAVLLDPGLLPVLVADYLALHLAIYGALQLGLLMRWRAGFGSFSPAAFLFVLGASAVIGAALDRYAANFLPVAERVWIVAALLLGAVPFFLADARLSHDANRLRRIGIHTAFLLSLVFAVALDFEGLFFLLMIAPVVVLFYFVFGTLGHAVAQRTGPLAPGLALGVVLAWSLGVSFPLFQP